LSVKEAQYNIIHVHWHEIVYV